MAVLLFLSSCGGELQTPGEALRIFGDSLPQAFAGEPYEAQVRAVGGLRPFTYQLQEGELPPGLTLEAGVISGVPTETGTFDFTITVSDANLSRTFEEYTLTITERPPPLLTAIAPETEIRTAVTVRLQVENAAQLRAFTSEVAWDETRFELVEGSVESVAAGAAIVWEAEPGMLHLEMAALGEPWNGALTLAQFTIAPTETARLRPGLEALFFDDLGGTHYQAAEPGSGAPATQEPGSEGDAAEEDGADGDATEVQPDDEAAEEPVEESEPGAEDEEPGPAVDDESDLSGEEAP